MTSTELQMILSVLQDEVPEKCNVDWYGVLGFLELNKIGGYFYNRVKSLKMDLPQNVERKLSQTLKVQAEKNDLMLKYIQLVAQVLNEAKIPFVFLKGSILSHAEFFDGVKVTEEERLPDYRPSPDRLFYGVGERVSNDIDILICTKDVGTVTQQLKDAGFEQGYYDLKKTALFRSRVWKFCRGE